MEHRAKKSLGQNFLKSESALRKIVEAGEIKPDDVILEIGPGKGALTSRLLEKASQVIAVEKDNELFGFLKIKFEREIRERSLVLVHGDILQFEIENYKLQSYKLIANIPYNITGAILKKFLTEKFQPTLMVLLVQHEVATRILARDGKESILSISVKAYGEPKLITKVDKRYFSPEPKVDSAAIKISNISRKNFASLLVEEGAWGGDSKKNHLALKGTPPSKGGEERFWKIVKKGFAHKRKKLSGNLKGICEGLTFTEFRDKRAENLTLTDWIRLAKES